MLKMNLRGFFDDHGRTMSPDEIQALYRWLSIPRYLTTAVSAIAISIFWSLQQVAFDPRPILFILVPIFIGASVVTDLLIRKNVHPYQMLHVQLMLDTVAVTAGVLLTGAGRSPFALLYILVIISASLLSVRTLIIFCTLTAVLFESVALADKAGLLSAFHKNAVSLSGQDPVSIVFFCLIAALIAFQSSYYVSRIRQKDEEVLKLKDDFLYRTIHDLRSPSTAMRYIVDKYQHDPRVMVTPDAVADFVVMEKSLKRMSNLIEDLLKVASGENTEAVIRRDSIDIEDIVNGALDELAPLMNRRNIEFIHLPVSKLPKVQGDAEKLKEVFNNFLDNAIKYNRDGGTITITHEEGVGGDAVVTTISDTGVGISEKSMQKLFAPFFRGDVGMEIPGTGLGLYMTKKLIQKMDCRVTCKSTPGEGTSFTVVFPKFKV